MFFFSALLRSTSSGMHPNLGLLDTGRLKGEWKLNFVAAAGEDDEEEEPRNSL